MTPPPGPPTQRAFAVEACRRALAEDPQFSPLSELLFLPRGELGRGGMGVVERVEDRRLGRLVARKVLLAPDDRAARLRFLREVRITARLDHPSIPPVFEAGTDAQGRPFYLMRLIAGETLAARIAAAHEGRPGLGPRPEDLRPLIEALVRLGQAVAYAHAQGVIHRDLKPANVILGRFGEVMLMDWGLARELAGHDEDEALRRSLGPAPAEAQGLTGEGAVMGTLGYMPPEQAEGEPVDARADVFALGAILCEALSGRPPLEGASFMNRLKATLDGRVVLPRQRWPGCPAELDDVCAAALRADRDERTPDAETFLADLQAWLAGEPVRAHRYRLGERLRRWVQRHPAALITGTLLLLLGALLLVLQLQRMRAREAVAHSQRLEGVLTRLGRAQEASWSSGPEQVEQEVREAVELGQRQPTLLLLGAEALAKIGRFGPAEALATEASEAAQERETQVRALLLLHEMQASQDLGQIETPAMRRLVALSEGRDDALSLLGQAYRAVYEQDLPRARQLLARAVALHPDFVQALNLEAWAANQAGDLEAAARSYRRVSALRPRSWRVQLSLAAVLGQQDQDAEALQVLAAGLELAPDQPDLLYLRALLRAKAGELERARADLDRALAAAPDRPELLSTRGEVLRRLRQYGPALADLEGALRSTPDDPPLLAARADLLRLLGRKPDVQAALPGLVDALDRHPDHPRAQDVRRLLRELEAWCAR